MPDGLKICAVSRVEFDTAIEWTTNEGWNPGLDGDGLKTWQVSMAQLGERVIGLDGVIDQQANYWKLGFKLAHRNVRYSGDVACEPPTDTKLRRINGR